MLAAIALLAMNGCGFGPREDTDDSAIGVPCDPAFPEPLECEGRTFPGRTFEGKLTWYTHEYPMCAIELPVHVGCALAFPQLVEPFNTIADACPSLDDDELLSALGWHRDEPKRYKGRTLVFYSRRAYSYDPPEHVYQSKDWFVWFDASTGQIVLLSMTVFDAGVIHDPVKTVIRVRAA